VSELLEEIKCNICGSVDDYPFLKMDGFIYRKCRNCGLIYQNPRPVFIDLKNRYHDNYFDYEFANQKNFFNLMKLGLKDIDFEHISKQLGKEKTFLDIGCATGLLINHMKKNGWKTKGVDICRPSAEYGIKNYGLDIFIGTLEKASFPDDYFDVVHLSHLIEHVSDPKGTLLEIKRVLKKDGYMILTTPNADGFQARIARNSWRSAIPDHIFLFSKKTMSKLLEITGFEVIKQLSWGGIPKGKRPAFIKRPADKLAKMFNIGDVMLFNCKPLSNN